MRNVSLGKRTVTDIDGQVAKVLRGLGNPEPPIDLRVIRDLLKLDRGYYSTTDDNLLKEMFSRMMVGGKQVLMRPTLLADAVRTLSLKALYLPDQKRILLDRDLPILKHRWNEAHEIGHDLIPWHTGMMLGDTAIPSRLLHLPATRSWKLKRTMPPASFSFWLIDSEMKPSHPCPVSTSSGHSAKGSATR